MATITAPEINDSRFAIAWRSSDDDVHAESLRQFEFKKSREIALELIQKSRISISDAESERLFLASPDRVPHWPSSVVGSITHKNSVFGVAVARKEKLAALGIDTEIIFSLETASKIRSRILTPEENKTLQTALQVTIAFSAKESLYKALYPEVQRYFGFQAAQVRFESTVRPKHCDGQCLIKLNQDLSDRFRTGQEFTVHYAVRDDRVYTWIAIS